MAKIPEAQTEEEQAAAKAVADLLKGQPILKVQMCRALFRESIPGDWHVPHTQVPLDWPHVEGILQVAGKSGVHNVVEVTIPRVMADAARQLNAARLLPARVKTVTVINASKSDASRVDVYIHNRTILNVACYATPPVTRYKSLKEWKGMD